MRQSTGLIEVTSHTDALVGSAAIPNRQYLTELGKETQKSTVVSINQSLGHGMLQSCRCGLPIT